MKWEVPTQRNMLLGLVAVLLAALIPLGISYYQANSQAVATVDGQRIEQEELYQFMVRQNGPQALDSLVSQKIVELEAGKRNVGVSEEEIQADLQSYYDYYGGEEAFMQTLAASGYTLERVREDIALNIKIEKLLEPRIAISDEEMKTYFEENQADFAREEQVQASHILVDTEEKAREIEQRLANGEDFAQLARENSTDTASAANGGDLGFFGRGQMVAEFEAAALGMQVGQVSEPVKTDYGYHIIKVTGKKAAQPPDFEQSRDKIREALFEQKSQAEFDTWLQEMHGQYEIKTFLD
ncbi:MAG: peptidylprolyl isomerase [Syntrophomonadaceae bacterium]